MTLVSSGNTTTGSNSHNGENEPTTLISLKRQSRLAYDSIPHAMTEHYFSDPAEQEAVSQYLEQEWVQARAGADRASPIGDEIDPDTFITLLAVPLSEQRQEQLAREPAMRRSSNNGGLWKRVKKGLKLEKDKPVPNKRPVYVRRDSDTTGDEEYFYMVQAGLEGDSCSDDYEAFAEFERIEAPSVVECDNAQPCLPPPAYVSEAMDPTELEFMKIFNDDAAGTRRCAKNPRNIWEDDISTDHEGEQDRVIAFQKQATEIVKTGVQDSTTIAQGGRGVAA